MDPKRCSFGKSLSTLSAMVVAVAIMPGDTLLSTPSPLPSQSSAQAPKFPPDQLDSLVAPIALYPALADLPDVVKRLADDIQWTTDLGNAFLAQQGDVMDAVQRIAKKGPG